MLIVIVETGAIDRVFRAGIGGDVASRCDGLDRVNKCLGSEAPDIALIPTADTVGLIDSPVVRRAEIEVPSSIKTVGILSRDDGGPECRLFQRSQLLGGPNPHGQGARKALLGAQAVASADQA